MKRLFQAILLTCLCCTWAAAESSVWRVRKDTSVVYLAGTFHILRDVDYPLPPEYEQAYRASETLVFETDMAELQKPETQQKMLAKAMYSDGSTVDRHLSKQSYAELKAYCDVNGMPLQALARFRPAMLMTTLTLMELMKMGVTQKGVDSYFHERAKRDGKPEAALEAVDEQIEALVSMADGKEDEFVRYSLEEIREIRGNFEELAGAWRKGDAAKLDGTFNAEMKQRQPGLYRALLVDRNGKWLPQIDAFLKTPRTELVLVGVAHLVGPDGLLEAFRKKGYTVEQVGAAPPPPPPAPGRERTGK